MNDSRRTMTDELLAAQAAQGDEQAFAELVRRHKQGVLRLAARFVRSRGELDDLAQEAFIKAYDGLGGFRGEATFRNWLFRIAANVCLDHLRRRKREPAVALEDLDWEPADTAYAERADSRELAAYVEKILDRLKAKDRLVLTLLDLEDMSVEEVAALTGWSRVNVRVRAFRARSRLRKLVEEDHGW